MTPSGAAAVGFVGLGNIGRPMAERLAGWDRPLWVFDVLAAATEPLAALGARVAGSPRQLAEAAPVVSVMVRDDEQVHEVVAGRDGLLAGASPGSVIVIHSTIRPGTAADLERLAEPYGVGVLDAPVSGGAAGAKAGGLAVMCGGPDDAFAAARPVLERLGNLVLHLGPIGSGTRAKLARNLLHFVTFAATGESARLAEAAGIDPAVLGRIVRHTDAVTGGPGAILLRDTAAPLAPDDPWVPIFEAVRGLGEKDLRLAIDLAGSVGVDVPFAAMALDRLGPALGLPAGGEQ